MILMISQPMYGKSEETIKEERKSLVEKLEKEGHKVLDTIFADGIGEMNDNDIGIYYLAKSIDAIGKVDGLVFMPGWENSRGCKIEYQVAKEYGKFIREVK